MSTIYQDLPVIREIQGMLNAVRGKHHYKWDYLSVDGKYGPKSKNAVVQFKSSIGFTPGNDDLTTEFLDRLREDCASVPMFMNSTDDLVPYDTGKLEDRFPIRKMISTVSDLFDNISGFVDDEMDYIQQTGRRKAGIVKRLSLHVSRFDNRFAQLRDSVEAAEKSQAAIDTLNETIEQNEDFARQASKGNFSNRHQNPADTLRNKAAQSKVSKAQGMIDRVYRPRLIEANNSANSIMEKIKEDLKKCDIVGKIDRKIQEILPKEGQYSIGKVKIRVNAGGTLLTLVSLKDLIYDLFTYEDSDAWRAKAKEHLYDFIDGVIIGIISAFLAKIIVLAGVAIVGTAGTAGAIAVIIAVVAVAIAIAIGYFFDKHDISLSRMVVDYCADIVPAF